ncbi:hypothetical protein GQ651_07660 [Alphaproteobacteria bacterium GH1-50]|uniref:Uncharacterized protein n=1 Tax=Kangsaoukella pontilimi TaxID=2691042 RepID=A0A7C9NDT2_9RHOB|nr:hypothetical protein [Kangsaoukella pontilimi]MXQ07719.1 hypothetical protein [Kangsaoukella pontilimi]
MASHEDGRGKSTPWSFLAGAVLTPVVLFGGMALAIGRGSFYVLDPEYIITSVFGVPLVAFLATFLLSKMNEVRPKVPRWTTIWVAFVSLAHLFIWIQMAAAA